MSGLVIDKPSRKKLCDFGDEIQITVFSHAFLEITKKSSPEITIFPERSIEYRKIIQKL